MWGPIWWMVFGWGVGHMVDAYMEYSPPDGAFGGGGGGGFENHCRQMTAGSAYCGGG